MLQWTSDYGQLFSKSQFAIIWITHINNLSTGYFKNNDNIIIIIIINLVKLIKDGAASAAISVCIDPNISPVVTLRRMEGAV